MSTRQTFKLGIAILLVLGIAGVTPAMAGTLDQSFGMGGQVLTPLSGSAYGVPDVAIQPDGKIVTVGSGAIVRYNNDGSLDASFGSGGQISSSGSQVEIQADGKILVGGATLSRYLSNGTLDSTFGVGGQVNNGSYNSNELLLQNDGKILWISQVYDYTDPQYGIQTKPQLARYLSNGSLDTSFAQNGLFDRPRGNILALQSDGKILAGASSFTANAFEVTRYTAGGVLDNAFGSGGTATVSFTPPSALRDYQSAFCYNNYYYGLVGVLVQADDKIVLTGNSTYCNSQNIASIVFSAARLQPNGSLDGGYGNSGISSTSAGKTGRWVYGATIQADGRAIVVGEIFNYPDPHSYSGHYEFAIVRFNTNGSVDKNFSGTTRVGDSATAFAAAVQADGKVVAVGRAAAGATYQALVRYLP